MGRNQNAEHTKVIYKGKEDDFAVMVDSPKELENWKKDSSIPLTNVVSSFKVFVSHKQGAQGRMDGASNQSLENEFGTHSEDECIKKILLGGSAQVKSNFERHGDTNMADGGLSAH